VSIAIVSPFSLTLKIAVNGVRESDASLMPEP